MPKSSKPEPKPSKSSAPDVVAVIDRTALIENVINQIISGFCQPRKDAEDFMWHVVLDTSVMSLGAKVKVVMAVSHEMDFKLDKNSLHKLIALRNAFAHHASDAYPAYVIGKTHKEDSSHYQLWILESSGKKTRSKRIDAFAEFNNTYRAARESLVKLKDMVNLKYPA